MSDPNDKKVVDEATAALLTELSDLQSSLRSLWTEVEGHRETLMANWDGPAATAFNGNIDRWEEDFIVIEKELNTLAGGVQGYQQIMTNVEDIAVEIGSTWYR